MSAQENEQQQVGKEKKQKALKQPKPQKPQQQQKKQDGGGADSQQKKQTKLGLEIRKDENYSEWYSQVRKYLFFGYFEFLYFLFLRIYRAPYLSGNH